MYHHLRRTFGVTLCLLGLASPLVCAAAPPSTPSPAAQLVAVQGASHPYRLMDYDHRVVTAAVPAQALTDVQTHHPDGTVQATVATIDFATGRIQAATDAGMSERQRDTAVRVANVPPRILESAVEARRVDRLAVLRLSARQPCRRRILALTY